MLSGSDGGKRVAALILWKKTGTVYGTYQNYSENKGDTELLDLSLDSFINFRWNSGTTKVNDYGDHMSHFRCDSSGFQKLVLACCWEL